MNAAQRATYFGLYADACATQRWLPKDDARRRQTTLDCMAAIRGPEIASTSDLGEDEITALFCYLRYLATGDADLDAAARWTDCQQDYHAFARARQADWHEVRLYGAQRGRGNKLVRDRFAGRRSAEGDPLETFDPAAIRKRHLTMATRHQRRQRQEAAGPETAGQNLATPEPARRVEEFDPANPF